MAVLVTSAFMLIESSSFAESFAHVDLVEDDPLPIFNRKERCSCDLLKSPNCTPTTWGCYGSFEKGILFEYEHVLKCEQSAMPDGTTECVKVSEKRTVQCGVFATAKECKDGGIVKDVKLPLECDEKCRIVEQPRWIPCELPKKIPGKEGFEEVLSECEQCSDSESCGKSYCIGVRLDPDNGCEPSLEPAIAGCAWGKGGESTQAREESLVDDNLVEATQNLSDIIDDYRVNVGAEF
jgi:hypothetical protein